MFRPQNHQATSSILTQTIFTGDKETMPLKKTKADFDVSNYDVDQFWFDNTNKKESCAEVQRRDWWEGDQRIHRPKT